MTHLFDITHIIITYGYLGIFLIVFFESGIFFLLPGDSLLFTAGIFASAFGMNIFLLILIITLATFLGNTVGYEIGRYLVKLNKYYFFKKIFKKEHIDTAHKFFVKYGKMAITFSRFVPVVRTFVPIVAGVARMKYTSFLKYNILGAVLWSSVVTLLGYFLGHVFPQVKDYLWVIVVLVVFVSILPMILELMRRQRKPRSRGTI